MRRHIVTTAKALLILGFSTSSAFAQCGFTASGDYVCGGGGENAPAVQNRGFELPQPDRDDNPIFGPRIPGETNAGDVTERLQTLREGAERLASATDGLNQAEKMAVAAVLTENDIGYEDIANYDGSLLEGSGSTLTFMGIALAGILATLGLGGDDGLPADGNLALDVTDGFEDQEILNVIWNNDSIETVDFVDDPVFSGEQSAQFGPESPSVLESDLAFEADEISMTGWYYIPSGQNVDDLTIMNLSRPGGVPGTSVTLNNNGQVTLNHYDYDSDTNAYSDFEDADTLSNISETDTFPRDTWFQVNVTVNNQGAASVSIGNTQVASAESAGGAGSGGTSYNQTQMGKVSSANENTIFGDDFNVDIN